MSEEIKVNFNNDFDCMLEASKAVEPLLASKTIRWLQGIHRWTTFGLVIWGIYALLHALIDPLPGIAIFFLLLGSTLAALGFFMAIRLLERPIYKRFCETSFGGNASVTIDATGFAYVTPNSTWKTGWGDVTDVFMTENTLGIVTPSMPFYVPNSAFEDPRGVFLVMQRYHKEVGA